MQKYLIILCILFSGFHGFSQQDAMAQMPQEQAFADTVNGLRTELIVLKNKNGMVVGITNFGARIVSILVPDRNGKTTSVVVGFDSVQNYVHAKAPYYGAIVGRYANRIANGELTINDQIYSLSKNNNGNTNHGGFIGFHNRVWTVESKTERSVTLSYFSKDMEEGFPGNVTVTVTYQLSKKNEISILYNAITDKETVINLTNHAFFNLNGEGSTSITNHILKIEADAFTPTNDKVLPTGEVRSVATTVFDFRQAKVIATDINSSDEQLALGSGYDHNFVLRQKAGEKTPLAATITSPVTGITLKVFTDQPGLQFFSGNFFKGLDTGRTGNPIVYRSAFCLEPQHFPDAPHHVNFPSTILKPGQNFTSISKYRFLRNKKNGLNIK